MPGWELISKEEQKELNDIFRKSNGVLFAHGFDKRRNNIFRVKKFEKDVENFLRVKYCITTTSGTMAQYIAMKALGIKKGDEVITQAFTFVATVEAILEIGAKPIIVDIDKTFNMSPEDLKKKISKKTKLLIPVPMLGNQCSMKEIIKIAKKNKIKILEDSCEALGAKLGKKFVGTMGDAGVFSLDFAKTITTGEGGLIVTNNKKINDFCREFRDHGHQNNSNYPRGQDTRTNWGLNLRMSELQAAVGIAQLKKLKIIVKKNYENKSLLKKLIKNPLISFREIVDKKGDLSDTLIFYFKNKKLAKKFVINYNKRGYSTKNLPDAINWHFAGTWKHIFSKVGRYKKNWRVKWKKSEDLLRRSISIPIYVKSSKQEIIKQSIVINQIFKSL
tara:strand:+ start:221 stop:1387 length:1167 start_codon:yes stop_codon:yes gene_type:complete